MADQNTSLPVRSQADGLDERLHAKLVDYADPSGVDKQLEITEKLAHVRVHGQDEAGTKVQLRLSEDGHANGDGIYDATDNTDPASVGLVALERNAAPADSQQVQRLTSRSNGTGSIRSLDVSLLDENAEPFTASNPLPVTVVDSEGTEVNDYLASAAVAAGASANHDYTVTAGTTLKLTQVWASASGKMKVEVQVETGVGTGTFTSRFVAFVSASDNNVAVSIPEAISVAAGVRVRVIRTNRDNQAQDLYSTISGHEIV